MKQYWLSVKPKRKRLFTLRFVHNIAMKNLKNLERLQQLHNLILKENTGTPKDLSELLRINKQSVHSLMNELKEYEATISYSNLRKTFYYRNNFDLKVSVSVNVITNDEETKMFRI